VSQSPSQPQHTASTRGPATRPHISEWFGHRVFPTVAVTPVSLDQQRSGMCPFLTETLARFTPCVKAENSRGVCTISATSNGMRQDWLVCPYRALDDNLLAGMVRRLYGVPEGISLLIRPAKALESPDMREETLRAVRSGNSQRVFLYFQDKLGGEISLSRTPASPELSFDITVIELLPVDPQQVDFHDPESSGVQVGKYGVIELQTTDTHGSYKHAVGALTNALDLHGNQFPQVLSENPEWAGRRVEGPNISNVFKRTFYQIAFKFQVTRRDTSAGCILALPKPVWDSWQPFLGAPELREQGDGTWRLLDDHETSPVDWIYVFDIDDQPGPDGGPASLKVPLVIGTDAATLSRAAFDIAPAKAVEHGQGADAVVSTIVRRLSAYLPSIAN
jgi:hypothetical protein